MNWHRAMYLIELHHQGKCDPETCTEPGHDEVTFTRIE